MTDKPDLDELARLLEKATPGEWSYTRNPENTRWIIDSEPAHAILCTAGFEPDNEANAQLIVALRNAAPSLIAEVEALRGEVARLRGALELADCALRGANMNMNVVERKVRAALGEDGK